MVNPRSMVYISLPHSCGPLPKGYIPVLVGKEMERFMVHTKLFRHPCFIGLLEMAAQEFGYKHEGVLRIPCDVDCFRSVIALRAKS
ncbi:Small auxin-up RNA protein [Dioscorea alata]|uniref:Small auxin-up RNA protein n=1 Tax=Dioscorea alata TaxID=55571 RepID=A0ACB7U2E5_DIOAL|nr:Small auxin-up RNA protein [Dioscorea alata]